MADTISAIGRRKEAVCRVFIKQGSGKWDVNGRTLGDYFPRPALVTSIQQAFVATDTLGRYDTSQLDTARDLLILALPLRSIVVEDATAGEEHKQCR